MYTFWFDNLILEIESVNDTILPNSYNKLLLLETLFFSSCPKLGLSVHSPYSLSPKVMSCIRSSEREIWIVQQSQVKPSIISA